MTDKTSEAYLPTILRLRSLVGFLGERSQFAWWNTSFFGDYSLRSLEFVVPKTAPLAQYHGVVEAARRLHDEQVNVGSFHLFRLPEEVEQDLHALMGTDEGIRILQSAVQGKDVALAALSQMADSKESAMEGPASVGGIDQFGTHEVSSAIAAGYFFAFANQTRAYPYLMG
jgi:hypothetical protein